MDINLSVRYWPKCPSPVVDLGTYDEKALEYGETTIEMKVEETAFVLVDCWNLTHDGPPIAEGLSKYWDYNFIAGGRSWLKRDAGIVEEKILPCLTRVRETAMTVIHAPTSPMAEKYPQCRALAKVVGEPEAPPPRQWPPSEFVAERWRQFMALRYGENCDEYWNRIRPALDIAELVRPLENEVVVSTLAQMDYVLAQRKILNVIFAGFAANACLLLKPGTVTDMAGLGYQVVVLRDCTTAIEAPWSVDDLSATRATMDYIEMCFGYTATSDEFLTALSEKNA